MEVSALEFPRENIYVTIHAGVKTARRKVVSIKQFFKTKVYSQGGSTDRFYEVELVLGCLGSAVCCIFLAWEEP